jgi:hypothetical protein
LTITTGSDVSQADPEHPELTFSRSIKTFSGLHILEKLKVPIPFLLRFSPSAPNVVCLGEALGKNNQWLTVTDDLGFQQEWEWEWGAEYLLGAVRLWLQDWKKSTPRLQGLKDQARIYRNVPM